MPMRQTSETTHAAPKEQDAGKPKTPNRETDTEATQESDSQRGRTLTRASKRRSSKAVANGGGSAESSTFRGRTRWRSTSPFVQASSSRNPSAHDGGARAAVAGGPSASSAALLIRVALRNRRRSQSPSRSRTPEVKSSRGTRRRTRTSSRRLKDNPLLGDARPARATRN